MPPLAFPALPRLITYYQTHHTPAGRHISVLPLVTQPSIHLTHLILAAIHISDDPLSLTLNDDPPTHPRFDTVWAELRVLQTAGVKVMAMLGGAAKGTFARLDVSSDPDRVSDPERRRFEAYYAPLASLIRSRSLDGLDLDVEETMSLAGVVHLVDRLRGDFGPGFVITLAPVATALCTTDPRMNLSGFPYEALEVLRGREIAWYNAQFYCGWGDFSNPLMYEMLLGKGWPAEKIVVGMVTSPANGSGWVPLEALTGMVPLLREKYAGFGGIMGWEYFNAMPGGKDQPWKWAQTMTRLLRGSARGSGSMDGTAAAMTTAMHGPDTDAGEAAVPAAFQYFSDGANDEE